MRNEPLSSIAEINPPLPRYVSGDQMVTFVRMQDVSESGGIVSSVDIPFEKVSAGFTRFAENDVIFAKITPCMENGKGALATNLTNGIGCGSTEFHVLRAKEADADAIFARPVRRLGFGQELFHRIVAQAD